MTAQPGLQAAAPLEIDSAPSPGNASPAAAREAAAAALMTDVLARWGRRVALGTAFQDEGMVLLDLAVRIDPRVRVFTIDTGRLPAETHRFIEQVRERYGVEIEVYLPDPADVEPLVGRFGPDLFRRSVEHRLACCRARKVEPIGRVLATLDAWIAGLRREQAPSRAEVPEIGPDPRHPGVTKVSPLAGWSASDVAGYLERHAVPRHPLYARGYASIGCEPCTRPTPPGADPRAGRWWWEDGQQPKECGLHWRPPGPRDDESDETDQRPERLARNEPPWTERRTNSPTPAPTPPRTPSRTVPTR